MSPTVVVNARKVVIVTDDQGGYLSGRCIICEATGLLEPRHGYPYLMKDIVLGSRLVHKEECSMNAVLKNDGTFKE